MKDFTKSFKAQFERKKEADLKTKVEVQVKKQKEKKKFKGKTVFLYPDEIKIRRNIRDEYKYEEIERLAVDIIMNGQLEPVVITSDNFLLWGYRRYKAYQLIVSNPDLFVSNYNIKKSDTGNSKKIVCYQINKKSDDISDSELRELQFSENEQRRGIDNFQLSKLYHSYIEDGLTQKQISEKFGKSKNYISAIIKIKEIHPFLVDYLKQFQTFGWSQKKFIAINSKDLKDSDLQKLNELKKMIGWQPLYEIAKQPDFLAQKKAFIKLYKNRLLEEELKEDFSEILIDKDKHDEIEFVDKFSKMLEPLSKFINSIESIEVKSSDNFVEIKNNIENIKHIISKMK